MEPIVLWPFAVYLAAVAVVVGGMVGISYFLGQRHKDPDTDVPYESGVSSTGTARLRFGVQFYLNAVFFVVFDLEAAFIFAWAVAFRELGWPGYVALIVFVTFLIVGLAYLWRVGGLDWGGTALSARRGRPRVR